MKEGISGDDDDVVHTAVGGDVTDNVDGNLVRGNVSVIDANAGFEVGAIVGTEVAMLTEDFDGDADDDDFARGAEGITVAGVLSVDVDADQNSGDGLLLRRNRIGYEGGREIEESMNEVELAILEPLWTRSDSPCASRSKKYLAR